MLNYIQNTNEVNTPSFTYLPGKGANLTLANDNPNIGIPNKKEQSRKRSNEIIVLKETDDEINNIHYEYNNYVKMLRKQRYSQKKTNLTQFNSFSFEKETNSPRNKSLRPKMYTEDKVGQMENKILNEQDNQKLTLFNCKCQETINKKSVKMKNDEKESNLTKKLYSTNNSENLKSSIQEGVITSDEITKHNLKRESIDQKIFRVIKISHTCTQCLKKKKKKKFLWVFFKIF